MIFPAVALSLITGPVRTEKKGGRTVLTHLQKFSHFGFMVTWPFCFHFWLFWKNQDYTVEGKWEGRYDWLPGTERGIYFRTPGYRWDYDLGMKWTWGYFGTHWD